MQIILEIATTDFITTRSAAEGGADRIELCASLAEGGVTPSLGTVKKCREAFAVALFPIIRPRGGDFLYSEEEFHIMVEDIRMFKQIGCDGVVIGLLKADGEIDTERTAILVDKAYPMEVTFHRAFDRCKDPFEVLEQLINLGCQRILTSGQMPGAPEGADLIKKLIDAADERIIIMPGSGVRKENIGELVAKTGATEYHTSLRSKAESKMQFRHPSFAAADFFNPAIDADEVRLLKKLLHEHVGKLKQDHTVF